MISANRLRDLVSAYLSGAINLESFSNQFALASSEIEERGNSESIELSYKIESALADLSAGFISESSLLECLAICSAPVSIRVTKDFSVEPPFDFRKKDEPSSGRVTIDLEYA